MQVTETISEGLSREFKIVIPADDIESKMTSRLNQLGQSIRIPGFRPGKAPMGLLKKRYGDSVRGEILEQTIQDATQSAMTERGLRPAIQPKVEIVTFEDGADLEYKLAVELMPEIAPVEFSALNLERRIANVDEKGVEDAIARLAAQRRSFSPVSGGREAKEGDEVLIDFVGRVDGEAFEGGTADDFALELGSGRFIPGFEEQLVGAKAGDKVEVKVNFPDDYPSEALKGQPALFEVDLKEVREPAETPVDDALAQSMGMENLDGLRNAVREQMEREYAQLSRARLKRDLLDRLSETADFPVPAGMVEQEFEAVWAQVKQAMEQDRLDEEDKGKSEEELREQYRAISERRVRLGLLLSEIGQQNNLTVSQEDLNRAMSEQARGFPGQEQAIFEYYQKNPQAMQELHAPIFEEKVIDFIVEMAKVTDKTVSVEDLTAAPEGPVEQSGEKKKSKSGGGKKKREEKGA